MSKMRSTEFVSRAKNIAEHVATRYMWGTFGSQITASLIAQKAAQYPAYGFDRHKGYGTRLHYQLLREHGPSPIHRRTFLKNL